MNQEANPLKQFYRQEKFRVKLPSRGNFYNADSVIELDDNLEVGILPMTAQDEMLLKSPDSLLSGKAMSDVIKSCVPAVRDTKKLLACDIDTLMISIRRASYGDEADLSIDCPECKTENTFSMDLDSLLNQTETLDDSYEVVLPQGLTVFLSPGTFETLIKQYKVAFENTKAQRAISTTMSEEAAMQLFSQAFRSMSKLNYELVVDSITKIIYTDEENEVHEVTSKKHIGEFISNVDKSSVDVIDKKLGEINTLGVERTFDAVCKECGNKWEGPIEFNPVNFS